MTRSLTNELFTPNKEPEREFRSSRRHFKTLSLDELRSPDFNLLSNQEYSEEKVTKTMAETMKQYMSKTRADYGSGVVCMRTRSSSSNPVGESSPNPTSSNPKRQLLRAPTEGYAEAIVVPPILAEHFELKHSLINMMTLDQFFGLEKANPHDHIRCNLLERRTQDVLTIIENKSKCLAADGNTFSEFRDNIQGYISAAAVNYNQGNSGYRPPGVANQIRPPGFAQPNVQNNQNRFSQPQGYNRGNNFNQDQSYQAPMQQNQVVPLSELEKIKKMNEINIKAMQTQINNVKNELRNEMKTSIQASMSNQTNEIKNMMASFFQMNTASTLGSRPLPSNTIANQKGELKAITTLSGIVLDGPFVPMPLPFINPKEDERVEETLMDPILGLPELISTRMTLELANRAIYTPAEIARDVFVAVGKFTFPANFVIVDYESDPRVPLILARPFLRTAHALIDVHGEETILCNGDERLNLNMRHDTSSYSNQPQKESVNMINIYDDSCEDYLKDLFATNHLSGNPTFSSHPDLTSPEVINPLNGNTTSSSPDHLLEEFADELALIIFLLGNDDLSFDIESDLREIEYFLNHDPTKEIDSILENSVNKDNLAKPNDNLVDTIPEMFIDEHTLDYSSPPLYDEYMMMIFLKLSPIMMMLIMIHLIPRRIKSKSLNS
nr:hypothetical protein [Tanacetum cinerariifolium]